MGQISTFPISLVAAPAAVQPETREATRQVAAAVTSLNSAGYAGEGREITFSVDRESRLPIVKVIDTQSKEIIEQWPREYVLQLAAQLHQKGKTG